MVKNGNRREFKSAVDAVRQLELEGIKVSGTHISKCCSNKLKTHAGAVWMFL
jgi:hypothetical protein